MILGKQVAVVRQGYQLVDLHILPEAAPGSGYPVQVQVRDGIDLPRGTLQLDLNLLTQKADAAAYGKALGEMLFADAAAGAAYRQVLAHDSASFDGVRVRLWLEAPGLDTLPWERVYQPVEGNWRPLGTFGTTPFSRYVPAPRWDDPVVTQRPLRALVIIASPADLASYNLDEIRPEERQALHTTFDGLSGSIAATYLESGGASPPTLNQLRQHLANGFDLVHVLAHGARTAQGTVLYLEGANGTTDLVDSARLLGAVQDLRSRPVLGFLASCETAARRRNDAFVPLGPALVGQGGLRAVVAMTASVGVTTARLLTDQFYARLLYHGIVDLALNEGRALIQDQWDWGAPVLFSRLRENQLIDFPIGQVSSDYLSHSTRAIDLARTALSQARQQDAWQVFNGLQKLMEELSKSHRVLVSFASDLRDLPDDTEGLGKAWRDYYKKFKREYDAQDWVNEDTSCQAVNQLSAKLLPLVAPPLLDPANYAELANELQGLGNADTDLIRLMRQFLDGMNDTVEAIDARVRANDLEGALAQKQAFEAQITPTFRRSKQVLSDMSSSLHRASAA